MQMTRDQQNELRKMYTGCNFYAYSSRADRLAKKKFPVTAEERKAKALLEKRDRLRDQQKAKLVEQFEELKRLAHESIYFSGDVNAALKKVRALQALCK